MLSASMILLLSACSTQPVRIEVPASVKQACPQDLGQGAHSTFGDTTLELFDMYERYHVCAGAVHGGK
jgi:starvation-inducible outer membrane lipoprotein